jgi:hypothetical protein
MEIPSAAAPYRATSNENKGWGNDLQNHLQDRTLKNGYDRNAGIDNINYGKNNYRMICETIFSLAENYHHQYRSVRISQESQTAVKHYVDQLYDSNWKKQQDEWIIREGILQLYLNNIKFLVVPILLWPWDANNNQLWRQSFPTLIPDHYIMLNEPESYLPISSQYPHTGDDPGYHMSAQGQQVISKNFYRRMIQDHGLS